MESRLLPLVNMLRLHTDLVRNSLSGISSEDACAQPLRGANTIGFLAAHLVDSRYFLAATLGITDRSPLADYLEGVSCFEEVKSLPYIDDLRRLWLESEPHVLTAFDSTTAEMLATPARSVFPTEDHTAFGVATFLVHHEAYHLGQLGLLRKGLGYPPMSYERR